MNFTKLLSPKNVFIVVFQFLIIDVTFGPLPEH